MKKRNWLLAAAALLLACGQERAEQQAYFLQGLWKLQYMDFPVNDGAKSFVDDDDAAGLFYDSDSTLYACKLVTTTSGLAVVPTGKVNVTLVNKGGGEMLYMEDDNPRPLQVNNADTESIIIQRHGIQYSYVRADSIYREWSTELRDIFRTATDDGTSGEATRYVLSAKERKQERTILWFGYASALIALLAMVAAHLAITNRRAKRQLQLQLQQIHEVQTCRPQPVRQATETVERAYFASDDYATLQRRMASGQRLTEADRAEVEQQLKTIYPGFTSQLRGLYPMSELEYHTCLLIKLRIPLKDIATVLARDVSTISTVRSRLYKKVFGRKGGAKDWDDFLLSIAV